MSDKQTTALLLFIILAFALYLNNTPSLNQSGFSKLSEILGILGQGFTKVASPPSSSSSYGGLGGGALTGSVGSGTALPPLWGNKTFPDVNLPNGYYSPSFVTDFQSYLNSQYNGGF